MLNVRLKTVVQYLLFLGLGLGLIWYSSKDLTPEQIDQLKNSWKQARFVYLLPVLATLLLSHYSRTLRWKILMEPLGYQPHTLNTYLSVLIGYFFNMLVPRLGEVMKCTILARYEKVAPDKLVGTILAERAVDFVSLILVALFMMIIQFDLVGDYMLATTSRLLQSKGGNFSFIRVFLFLLVIAAFIFLFRWLFKKFSDNAIIVRLKSIVTGIWAGLTSLKNIKHKKTFLLHTFIIWALYLSGIYLGFLAFPPVAHLGFKASVSVLVFGSLGMIATQGGIGAYQIAVEKTLQLFGVAAVIGLSFGWLIWAAQTIIVLISGIVALLVLPIINRKKTTL